VRKKRGKPPRGQILAEFRVGRFYSFWVVQDVQILLFEDVLGRQVFPALHHAMDTPVAWYVRTDIFPEFSCN
jgi:hypothetical protein